MNEYLANLQENREKERILIKERIEEGQFSLLPPRTQQILAARYLGENMPSYKEIGEMFKPHISEVRVAQIEVTTLRMLRRLI